MKHTQNLVRCAHCSSLAAFTTDSEGRKRTSGGGKFFHGLFFCDDVCYAEWRDAEDRHPTYTMSEDPDLGGET